MNVYTSATAGPYNFGHYALPWSPAGEVISVKCEGADADGTTSEFSLASADLNLTGNPVPSQAGADEVVHYAVAAKNGSPAFPSGPVIVTLTLPADASVESTSPGATQVGQTVTWHLDTIFSGQTRSAGDVAVRYLAAGARTVTATVTGDLTDPVSANNTVTWQTEITPLPTVTLSGDVRDTADGAVSGVTLELSGGGLSPALTTTSDAYGHYAFAAVPQGGPYTLTASRTAFTFAPPAQTFASLQANTTAAVFIATNGIFTQYFAEGATGFFHTAISLLNPSTTAATATVRYQRGDGGTASRVVPLPAMTQVTIDPATEPGFEATEVSTAVESDAPIVASRAMTWDETGYGRSAESAVSSPGRVWYLAEGATTGDFHLYYLIQNPGDAAADVEITYLLPAPEVAVVKTYSVPAHSRRTIDVKQEDARLASTEVAAIIRSTNPIPVVVERALYRSSGGIAFEAGTVAAAVGAPSRTWFFAEGCTGNFFDLFLLLANPNAEGGDVEVKYLLPDGTTVTRTYALAAQTRRTIYVNGEGEPLAATPLAIQVTAPEGLPIVAERAMWWPGGGTGGTGWYEGHDSAGVTEAGALWAVAGGEIGGPLETHTYLLLANLAETPAPVRVRLTIEGGSPMEGGGTTEKILTLLPNSRTTLDALALLDVPDTAGATGPLRRFAAVIESLGDGQTTPVPPIVVESSVYSNSAGVLWRAGSNSVATRLR
jgi:hypothetical protein